MTRSTRGVSNLRHYAEKPAYYGTKEFFHEISLFPDTLLSSLHLTLFSCVLQVHTHMFSVCAGSHY